MARINDPETLDHLRERMRLVEANAELLDGQLREARRTADQTIATLCLLLSLVSATRDGDAGFLLNQLVQDLLICADTPELAVQIAGCEPEAIDPQMIRASAAMLSGEAAPLARGRGGQTTH